MSRGWIVILAYLFACHVGALLLKMGDLFWPDFFGFGFTFIWLGVTVFGLIPGLALIAITEISRIKAWWLFAIVGALCAYIPLHTVDQLFEQTGSAWETFSVELGFVIFAGVIAGLSYWLFAWVWYPPDWLSSIEKDDQN